MVAAMAVTGEQGRDWAERLVNGIRESERRWPLVTDVIDRAGTRHEFCYSTDAGAAEANDAGHDAARRFHGTAQTYYRDDPERGLPE